MPRIAMYGTYIIKVPVRQRYWKKRKDGVLQRYWKTTRATKKAFVTGRYEFYGAGRDLYRAVLLALRVVPKKRFTIVSAREFLAHPAFYGVGGKWIDRKVVSH